MYDGEIIYECELLSVIGTTKNNDEFGEYNNLIPDTNEESLTNIEDADTEVVAKIMVEPTLMKNVYREIVTGKLIPAYVTYYDFNIITDKPRIVRREVPSLPIFIKVERYLPLMGPIEDDLKPASLDSIKEYVELHKKDEYRKQLIGAFRDSKANYNRLRLAKMKQLIKNLFNNK